MNAGNKKHTQHAPSTKTECDYLNGWIKKTVTYAKISPKSGEPQRYSWETQKKKKKVFLLRVCEMFLIPGANIPFHAPTTVGEGQGLCAQQGCAQSCQGMPWTVMQPNNNTLTTMYHPQRQNVTTSMAGLNMQNLTQNGEPQRYSWGTQKKKKKNVPYHAHCTKKACHQQQSSQS